MIRWINDRIGTSFYNYAAENCSSEDIYLLDVRDLVDKSGNQLHVIKKKIDVGLNELDAGKKVIVCCDYGMSRSNAIAAGLLTRLVGIPFNEAVGRVLSATGEKAIKIEVLTSVRNFIEGTNSEKRKLGHRILVTGSSGFLGNHLVKKLNSNYEIFTITNLDLSNSSIELDLYVRENNIGTIVHLANPRVYTSNEAMGQTLVMLKNVLQVCQSNSIKLIYPSTWEVYSGYRTDRIYATEALPLFPIGAYGETKYLAENLINLYIKQGSLNCAVLRFSPIYGYGSDRPKFIYTFMEKAIKNEDIITHKYINGFPTLDLLNINDAIDCLREVIDKNVTGFYNVGSGTSISTNDVAKLVVKEFNSNSKVSYTDINSYCGNITLDSAEISHITGWSPKQKFENWLKEVIQK